MVCALSKFDFGKVNSLVNIPPKLDAVFRKQ